MSSKLSNLLTLISLALLTPAATAVTTVFHTYARVSGNALFTGPTVYDDWIWPTDNPVEVRGSVSAFDYSLSTWANEHEATVSSGSSGHGIGEGFWGYYYGNTITTALEAYVEVPAYTHVQGRYTYSWIGDASGSPGTKHFAGFETFVYGGVTDSAGSWSYRSGWLDSYTEGAYHLPGYGDRVFSRVHDGAYILNLTNAEGWTGGSYDVESATGLSLAIQTVPEPAPAVVLLIGLGALIGMVLRPR